MGYTERTPPCEITGDHLWQIDGEPYRVLDRCDMTEEELENAPVKQRFTCFHCNAVKVEYVDSRDVWQEKK